MSDETYPELAHLPSLPNVGHQAAFIHSGVWYTLSGVAAGKWELVTGSETETQQVLILEPDAGGGFQYTAPRAAGVVSYRGRTDDWRSTIGLALDQRKIESSTPGEGTND